MNIAKRMINNKFKFTKNQRQIFAPYYLFVGYFCYTFRPDLIGHLQGQFCRMCSIYFNLTIRVFTYD